MSENMSEESRSYLEYEELIIMNFVLCAMGGEKTRKAPVTGGFQAGNEARI